jgi:RecB family exonuclease
VITPRRITLISVPGLRALQRAIAQACAPADAALARATAVLVPTRAAAAQLRRTLEELWLIRQGACAVVFPDILTRTDWYRRMSERVGSGCRVLSDIEREVLMGAAARDAIAGGRVPPFRMRPGLVAEMLALHDALVRQQKSVADFQRLVLEDLEPRAEFDRGAERLLRQTRFLGATFEGFAQRVEGSGSVDEARLRQRLLEGEGHVYRRVIVTVGDHVGDRSAGLYPVDYDLLSRLPQLESVDLVATRNALLSGLGERLRALLPGLEENSGGESEPMPVLIQPAGAGSATHFTSRDREEELRDIARRIKKDLRAEGAEAAGSVAVVFRRPLPYVYLGRTVLESAGLEYQAADALPLAAEPFAAALDLVFAAVTARFARGPLVQLLLSPHFVFAQGGREPAPAEVNAFDRALAEGGYLGDADRLRVVADATNGPAGVAARAAAALVTELEPLAGRAAVSQHLAVLLSFVRAHERLQEDGRPASPRHLRARAGVLRVLEDLRDAASRFDDPDVGLGELAASVRRWLESQTFTPARGEAGVQMLDAQSARYGDFDQVHLAGLIAGDWPEASSRNIFYPPFLLASLGWPPESARLAAERAAFADLLRLARRRVSVSSFTLEDDSIVEPSPLLEEVERSGLATARMDGTPLPRVFTDEALTNTAAVPPAALSAMALEWLDLRASRTPATAPQFHGFTALQAGDETAAPLERAYTITGIDRYLECPFKYFARSVLDLPDEAPDELGLSARERGRFVHEVFRAFFAEWQRRGEGAITVDRLDAARELFARVAEEHLTGLPRAEASVERLRLTGSVAAPGLGEIVLAAEAVRPTPVVERLLEFSFDGRFTLHAGGLPRTVRLRGKADRVDVLADGRLRVIDYKLGRAPDGAIQLPIYAFCLEEQLRRDGRAVEIGEAFYVAFGDRRRPVESALEQASAAATVQEAQERLLAAVEGIERGAFPPSPATPRLCGTCAYAAVCRKDYVVAD